jgi:hypothetical protein
MRRPKRRLVRFRTDPFDRIVMENIGLGSTSKFIALLTGLSVSQVNYRASKLTVKRKDVRNGNAAWQKNRAVRRIVRRYMDLEVRRNNIP